VLDWFDGDSATSTTVAVCFVCCRSADDDDFRYQAALDITDDSEAVTRALSRRRDAVCLCLVWRRRAADDEFIERVVKQLAAACQSGSDVPCAVGCRRASRRRRRLVAELDHADSHRIAALWRL
jgi:hypothetical protein